jgi:hypothetical protein
MSITNLETEKKKVRAHTTEGHETVKVNIKYTKTDLKMTKTEMKVRKKTHKQTKLTQVQTSKLTKMDKTKMKTPKTIKRDLSIFVFMSV